SNLTVVIEPGATLSICLGLALSQGEGLQYFMELNLYLRQDLFGEATVSGKCQRRWLGDGYRSRRRRGCWGSWNKGSGYEEFIGAKKHLVLGVVSHSG